MKKAKDIQKSNIENLAEQISNLDFQFRNYAYKQVNTLLTIRNWLIGYYIYEFEQKGEERAEYGEKLYKNLVEKLRQKGIKGLSKSVLHICSQFYKTYPQIVQSVIGQFKESKISQTLHNQFNLTEIGQSLPDQFILYGNVLFGFF